MHAEATYDMSSDVVSQLQRLTDPTLTDADVMYVVETIFLSALPEQRVVPKCIAAARHARTSMDWFRQIAQCYTEMT